jgi:hypothetical protein
VAGFDVELIVVCVICVLTGVSGDGDWRGGVLVPGSLSSDEAGDGALCPEEGEGNAIDD